MEDQSYSYCLLLCSLKDFLFIFFYFFTFLLHCCMAKVGSCIVHFYKIVLKKQVRESGRDENYCPQNGLCYQRTAGSLCRDLEALEI